MAIKIDLPGLCSIMIVLCMTCVYNLDAGVLHSVEKPCSHTVGRLHDDVFYNVRLEPHHEIKKRSADQPLRIKPYYDTSIEALHNVHQDVVKEIVQKAVEFWESALRVRPSRVPIRLRRKCMTNQLKYKDRTAYCMYGCLNKTVCGDITIPEEHLEGCIYYEPANNSYVQAPTPPSFGVSDTDYILYIASIPSRKCIEGQTIAYAAHCQQEEAFDRPVAGYFSICPNSISKSRQSKLQLLSTMKHEILHALGFTAGLYAFYRDADGEPLTKRNIQTGRPLEFNEELNMFQSSPAVVKEIVRPEWLLISGVTEKRIQMMVTPKVKKEVQDHFNCPTLEGAELEDQGIDGTVLTHWEKRIFENEAMTGTYTQNSVISRITLAMMEDTGWYIADYSKAGDYEWGRGLGCEFVQESCYQWISSRMARKESIHPFCDKVKRGELWTDCTYNRKSVALCNLVEYSQPLPAKYQYFDELTGVDKKDISRFAGSVALADYCPYLQEFSWTDERNIPVRGSNCQDSENSLEIASNYFGETYGSESLCFEHSAKWYLCYFASLRIPQHAGSGCYKYSCLAGVGIVISLENKTYRCYREKQVIPVSFRSADFIHQGSLVCPNCNQICKEQGITCPPDVDPPLADQQPHFGSVICSASSVHVQSVPLIVLMVFSISR
ncbi:leishmanolysin-like peptidase [Physella acuta]|uniref:leishmanolysin-like peptidase n=1 Tax=Physella acuta TaxID=109671 RepID=UPI0027DBFCA4|nr:leishmanolysin-like peptidase [Physella acuta]